MHHQLHGLGSEYMLMAFGSRMQQSTLYACGAYFHAPYYLQLWLKQLPGQTLVSFYSSGRILFSRCGDYIWLSGIYGHCTVEGEKLAIEDVTRNVFQSLQGEIFQLTRQLGVPEQLRLFRYDFCLKVAQPALVQLGYECYVF